MCRGLCGKFHREYNGEKFWKSANICHSFFDSLCIAVTSSYQFIHLSLIFRSAYTRRRSCESYIHVSRGIPSPTACTDQYFAAEKSRSATLIWLIQLVHCLPFRHDSLFVLVAVICTPKCVCAPFKKSKHPKAAFNNDVVHQFRVRDVFLKQLYFCFCFINKYFKLFYLHSDDKVLLVTYCKNTFKKQKNTVALETYPCIDFRTRTKHERQCSLITGHERPAIRQMMSSGI